MTFLQTQTPKTFAHSLASLQNCAWLPPALLLLALSSVFIFGSEHRGNFYRGISHNNMSAKNLAVAENLSPEHHYVMFTSQTIDADGRHTYGGYYGVYNRFPIGSYALIKLAILPFGDDLSAKIYAARMLMLLFFSVAAVLAYLSLRHLASSSWIALTATLMAFSSAHCLYYSDIISNEAIIDLFAVMLVFHGMAVFEQEKRFRQLLLKACAALLLGWHAYALLLPFIVLGLMRELIKTRPHVSTPSLALCQLKHTSISLLRSRYLTLGVAALLVGISMLTFNFTNEYFALKRETSLTELPSFRSMLNRTGVVSFNSEYHAKLLRLAGFPERQFYRVGAMSIPFAFAPSYFIERMTKFNFVDDTESPQRLFAFLGMAVSGASLIGLLFIRRHKILLASLALSGFCWALPMRYTTAIPNHNFEAIFYIGVTLTLFFLALMCLRRLSRECLIAALSVAALLVFVVSALRMAQPHNSNQQMAEFHKSTIVDFQAIRNATQDGASFHMQENPAYGMSNLIIRTFVYYLAGRIVLSGNETALSEYTSDFVITGRHADGLTSLTPQNRMLFLYEWDAYHRHIDQVIEQAGKPLISSGFDVYLADNTLIYVKDNCRLSETRPPFFLALYPADENALPDERSQHGFHNLDFRFDEHAVRRGKRCIARTTLPDYDIARIQTGQFVQRTDGSFEHLWEGDVSLTKAVN